MKRLERCKWLNADCGRDALILIHYRYYKPVYSITRRIADHHIHKMGLAVMPQDRIANYSI